MYFYCQKIFGGLFFLDNIFTLQAQVHFSCFLMFSLDLIRTTKRIGREIANGKLQINN